MSATGAARGAADPRVERTAARVLATVREVMEAEGLEKVTFGRISRLSGVSRSTLYRHWPSPSALIVDAWSAVAPANEIAFSEDLAGDLLAVFRSVRDVVESPALRRALPSLLATGQRDPALAALHVEFVRSRRRPIVDRLRAAVAAGELPAGTDPELAVDLLSGPIFYRLLLRRVQTSDAEVEAMVRTVLQGIRAGR